MLTVLGHAQGLDLKGPGGWVSKGRNGEQAGGGLLLQGLTDTRKPLDFIPRGMGCHRCSKSSLGPPPCRVWIKGLRQEVLGP